MIVIDASCVVALVLGTPESSAVAARLVEHQDLFAPHVLDIEVMSAVRRRLAAGDVDNTGAALALRSLQELPVERYAHVSLLERIWALRDHVQIADGAYVALAEALGATLLTLDMRLSRAHGLRCEVEVPS